MAPAAASLLVATLLVLAPATAAQGRGVAPALPDNVLLIVADDFGREKLAAYGVHPDPAPTPWLDALSAHGVTFDRFYTQMVCSPTRAAMLTGRQGFRTGIGTGVPWTDCENSPNGCFDWDVDGTLTLAEAVRPTHFPAAFGKWHLGLADGGRGYMHPIRAGFGAFAGSRQNLGGATTPPSIYFEWLKNVAGPGGAQQAVVRNYATTENVDDALRFIRRRGDRPWFTWLAFNTAHTPYHAPPVELAPLSDPSPDDAPPQLARAMVESMDTEIGRLLSGIRPAVLERTWVVFLCDNGPEPASVDPPYPSSFQAKPSGFEGNINMPMIVVGPGVVAPGRRTDHLVHAVDVYATICEMAGRPVPAQAVDSVSFLPVLLDPAAPPGRDVVYSERFRPNGPPPYTLNRFAVTDGRWKWGRLGQQGLGGGSQQSFHDLLADPNENDNLLDGPLTAEQQAALDFLRQRRQEILQSHGGGL